MSAEEAKGFLEKKTLSLYELLSLIISLIGLGSLIFLVLQTEQAANSLESAAWQTIQDQQLELNKKFVEESKLLPYFFPPAKNIDENNADYNKAAALADLKIDFFDSLWGQRRHLPELKDGGPAWRAWEVYIKDSFANSPIMCNRLNRFRHWYADDFVTFANEDGCSKLIPPPTNSLNPTPR